MVNSVFTCFGFLVRTSIFRNYSTHSPCRSRHIPGRQPRRRTRTDTAAAASSLSTVDNVTLLKFSSVAPLSSVCPRSVSVPGIWLDQIFILRLNASRRPPPLFIDLLKLVNNCGDSLLDLSHCHAWSTWTSWRNKRAKGLKRLLISQLCWTYVWAASRSLPQKLSWNKHGLRKSV